MIMKTIQRLTPTLLIATAFVLMILSWRAFMHGSNFAPVAAIALLSGYLISDKRIAMAVPVLAMLLSDLFFTGTYNVGVMAAVYLGFALPVLWSRARWFRFGSLWASGIANTLSKAVAASASFFLLSNLAVFLFTPLYGMSLEGLVQCYANALPFLRPTILGDLVFAGLGFGLIAFWQAYTIKKSLIRS